MPADIPDGFVAIARIIGAWGLRGGVKVEPLAPPEVLTPGQSVNIAGHETALVDVMSNGVRLKLAGIDDREAAAALRGEYILVEEQSLPPLADDQYYRFQLLGLRVFSTEGENLGIVEDVFSTRENDVYVVRGPAGEILVPATDDVVQRIDLASHTMTIEVVPGLLP